MVNELGQNSRKLVLVEDQYSIETLTSDRADEALSKGIRLWGSDWRADDPNLFGSEDPVEAGCELGIPVSH
jgi:hypothetical protein